MDSLYAEWLGRVLPNTSPEVLNARSKAIESITKSIENTAVARLVTTSFDDTGREPSPELLAAIRESDPGFAASRTPEIAVLAAIAADMLLQPSSAKGNVAALAVLSTSLAGSLSPSKVPELVARASRYVSSRGQSLRGLNLQTDFNPATLKGALTRAVAAMGEKATANPAAPIGELWTDVSTMLTAINETIGKVADGVLSSHRTMAQAQAVTYEESDILWWLTNEYSQTLDAPYSSLSLSSACLCAAVDLSRAVHFALPPVAARAVLGRVLASGRKKTEKVSLGSLAESYATDLATSHSNVLPAVPAAQPANAFPILSAAAAVRLVDNSEPKAWTAVFRKQMSVDIELAVAPSLLAYQLLCELLLHRALAGEGSAA